MPNNPLLSIICCTYNCAQDLNYTLKSIEEQDNQHPIEILVIDGASKDKTLFIAESYQEKGLPIRITSEKDKGIYDAMNKGIKQAKGLYLHFLNAGEVFTKPSSLSTITKEMTGPSPHIISCDSFIVDSEYFPIFKIQARDFTRKNLAVFGTAVANHQAFFIKRAITPYYSLDYSLKGELNWYFDIIDNNSNLNITYIRERVVKYRIGGKGNQQYIKNLLQWMQVTKKRCGIRQCIKNLRKYYRFQRYSRWVKRFYN